MVIVLVGVSGAGKTTVGHLLSSQMGWEFADADDYHSAANIQKMTSGIPLTDAERAWADALLNPLEKNRTTGTGAADRDKAA